MTILAVLLPIAAMIGAGAMARNFTEDNETRMVEMLVTSAPAFSVMAGKLAALVATGLVYIAVWITVAAIAVPAVVGSITSGVLAFIMSPELLVTVLAAFVLGYFLYCTLGLLVGVLVPSPVPAQRRMSILALFAGLPVGSLIADPLSVFTPILPYIPLTAPATVFLRLAEGDHVIVDLHGVQPPAGVSELGTQRPVVVDGDGDAEILTQRGVRLHGQRAGLSGDQAAHAAVEVRLVPVQAGARAGCLRRGLGRHV